MRRATAFFGNSRIRRHHVERGERFVVKALRTGLGALQPEDRPPGGLVVLFVLAGGLPQGGRVLRAVEDVVHHLEGEPQSLRIGGKTPAGGVAQAVPFARLRAPWGRSPG